MSRVQTYWHPADHDALRCAVRFDELTPVALRILGRMPQPVSQVCGPISTGGKGSIEANLVEFRRVIDELTGAGEVVFDQMPFEEHIFRIIDRGSGTRAQNQLLNQFYLPIFTSRFVRKLHFIPGWETSYSASWEHEMGQVLGIDIVYLSK